MPANEWVLSLIKPQRPQRLLILANPVAGRRRGRSRAFALAKALEQRGITTEVYLASGASDTAQRARSAGNEVWDGLVVVGGDGTVNEVLNGMPDLSRPIGVFPAGTANVLAIELQLPFDPDRAAAVIAKGVTRSVAVGLANHRRFLLFCGVGLDGAVVERMHQLQGRALGKLKWIRPILQTVQRWPSFSLTVTFPDGRQLTELQSVIVTRVRNYGGLLYMTRDVHMNSGALHVMCFRMRSRTGWGWQVFRALCRQLRPNDVVEIHAVSALRITGTAPYQIDGDFGGTAPIDLTLEPMSASIYAPR